MSYCDHPGTNRERDQRFYESNSQSNDRIAKRDGRYDRTKSDRRSRRMGSSYHTDDKDPPPLQT